MNCSPVFVDGTLYAGTTAGTFSAIDGTDGSISWRQSYGARFSNSSPAVGDGRVYVGCSDGSLYAIGGGAG